MAGRCASPGASCGRWCTTAASGRSRSSNRLAAGDRTIAEIVPAIYQGLAPGLRGAAGLSVFAHLEDLVERGLAVTDGPPTLDGAYRPG
jgi:hypothetical protein